MSGQFVLGVIVALLLIANWVTLYAKSDKVYQFHDGEMRVLPPQPETANRNARGVRVLRASPSDEAARVAASADSAAAATVTAAQFGILETYFNAAAGLCPSQRQKLFQPSNASQHGLLVSSISADEFRFFLDAALNLDTAAPGAKNVLDVRIIQSSRLMSMQLQ
jgi:hypothetical protein